MMKEILHSFASPWLFLLLIPAALALLAYRYRKGPSLSLPSLAFFRKASIRKWPAKLYFPLGCYAAGLILLTIALARPREGIEQIRRRSEGIDIMIALDLSGSMQAVDMPSGTTRSGVEEFLGQEVTPDRLKTAKQEIVKFINARPNDRIGLIAFSYLPYMVSPPTLDHSYLIANLNRLQQGITSSEDKNPAKFSTNLASPLALAAHRLKDSDARRKIIVFFTDGVNNINARVTPLQAAELAGTFNITVYTVGIGSDNAFFPTPGGWMPVKSEFDEELLKQIAGTTKGQYYHAEDSESMAQAMKAIDKLEKTSFEQQTLINWKELAPGFMTAAALLILLGFALENTVLLKAP